MMIKDNRRYYLDLKENSRGRFLRVSQTITRGGPRSQVAIPAQGMIEFRDALTDLLDEFSTDEHAYKPDLPEGRHMHVDNKNFYFDIGQNNRGVYMRISEVKTNFRTAITVPEKSWPRFRDILADYCDKIKQQPSTGGGGTGASNVGGGGISSDQPHPLVRSSFFSSSRLIFTFSMITHRRYVQIELRFFFLLGVSVIPKGTPKRRKKSQCNTSDEEEERWLLIIIIN
jgi:hypothetical protein